MNLPSHIQTYINKYQLLTDDKPVVIGLSGGADSVALTALLVRLGYSCIALHCNFHLRGEESDRDEDFARELADRLGIPFHKTDFATTQYAQENHLSIEMAARELRYRWFEEMRQQFNAQAIAIAHHQDDSVETMLINMIRGTGIRGLSGIAPKNGYIVRPLLGIARQDILSWLSDQRLDYVTDSTNLSDQYTRNFIRLRVLPLLEEINPAVKTTLARTSENLSAVETIYLHTLKEAKKKVWESKNTLSITSLMMFPSPETILYELLKPYGFTRLVSSDIFQSLFKESGKVFYSSDYRVIKDRDSLLLTPIEAKETKSYLLTVEEGVLNFPIELSWKKIVLDDNFRLHKDKKIAYFDYDRLEFPLTLRKWEDGDWFVPFGMKGRKKVSDYFSDHKFSLVEKEEVWLLCSGTDIIWIIGERTDNRFKIDHATKQALIIKFSC